MGIDLRSQKIYFRIEVGIFKHFFFILIFYEGKAQPDEPPDQ